MTVSTKHLVDAVNANILTSSSKVEDVIASVKTFDELNDKVFSVPNLASLPSAANNIGRLVWVTDISDYRYSDGLGWFRDFSSFTHSRSSVLAWGCNTPGQLGDNSTTNRSSPVSVVGGFTDWCQVSAGQNHSAALRTNGTLWTWGSNLSGKLGDNTISCKSSPVSVVGGFTDWQQVSASQTHTAAIRTNGTLWAWGYNLSGRLGDGTTVAKSSPVSVVGGFTDWLQVSSGACHTTALRTNGTIWAWGANSVGHLGNNTIVSTSSPVSVVGGFTDWCQVSAGWQTTAAVRTNGTLWSWGCNSFGSLGDNSTVNRSSPVSVVGGFTDWCQSSAGHRHSAAIRTNGTIWTWGNNSVGQLGNNTIVSTSSPVSIVGGFTDWCQVNASTYQIVSLRTNGTIWAWGCNTAGILGDNSTVNRSSPVSVVGGFTDWCQIGNTHSSTQSIAIAKKTIGF